MMLRLFLLIVACTLVPLTARGQCRPSDSPARSPADNAQPVPVYDVEPNDSPSNATRAWLGEIANGAVYPGDVDYFAFDVPAHTTLNLYAQVSFYGSPLWPRLSLLARDGQTVLAHEDSLSAPGDRGGRDAYLRYTVADSGRYYVTIGELNSTGSLNSWYSIKLYQQTPSPGDPVRVVHDGFRYTYWMKAGPGGLYVSNNAGIQQVSLDGEVTTFASDVYPGNGMAFDGLGDLLVSDCESSALGIIRRVSSSGARTVFADRIAGRPSIIAVGPDGDVWVCVDDKLLRFDPAGGLRDTVLSSYLLYYGGDIAFSPAGELHLVSYDGVHKLVGRELPLVIPFGRPLTSLAFDRDGYLYAGEWLGFPGGVVLYDPHYQIVNDPVARVDSQTQRFSIQAVAFARNDDGTSSRRLFALYTSADGARVVELNPNGVRAPGAASVPHLERVALAPLSDAIAGGEYSERLRLADGGGGTWALSTGSLPPGLSLARGTGKLSGIPTDTGSFSFTIKHTSGAGVGYAPATVVVQSDLPIDIAVNRTAYLGVGYADTLRLRDAPGAVAWQRLSGSLPSGVTLDAGTGVLSGAPTDTGVFRFIVRGVSGTRVGIGHLTINVSGWPTIAPADAASAVLGGAGMLSAELERFLDLLGNRNGKLDVGDLRAYLRAQHLLTSQRISEVRP